MKTITVDEIKEEAKDIMLNKLNVLCTELNDKYEDYLFYVRDDCVWLDCSDYSPRDVAIFKM